MTHATWKLLTAALLATAVACGKDSSGPVAGTLKIKLTTTPNSGLDGAILLSVTGPAVPSAAAAAPGFRLFGTASGTTSTFAATGTLSTGSVIMTISVNDVNQVHQYTASVVQVATSSSYILETSSAYALTVTK